MTFIKRLLAAATILLSTAACASGQSLDDLNIQIHGYATQGFIYSTNNNWNTADSSDGSAAWTEAVVNLSAQPESKLRIGVQARYFLLGNLGNAITLDWAQADYKVNEHVGFRVGKVKSPIGLLTDGLDVDPVQLWVALPQSVYPLAGKDAILAHFGGVVYGQATLGERLGKLEYKAYAGDRVLPGNDGYFQAYRDAGFTLPNGMTGPVAGATVRWDVPVKGLVLGATTSFVKASGQIDSGPSQGTIAMPRYQSPYFFARYNYAKWKFAGEYNRLATQADVQFPGATPASTQIDQRAFYVMAIYRPTTMFSGGMYYSSATNRQAALSSSRYQKDLALTVRCDINPFLYAKAEQHFMDGTELGFYASDNPTPQPTTRMTMLKLGVTF